MATSRMMRTRRRALPKGQAPRGPTADATVAPAGLSVDLSGLSPDVSGAPLRSYEVAQGYSRRSLSWRTQGFGPNFSLVYALQEIRNRSRDQVRKNSLARSAVDRLTTNIIGTGIKPQSAASDTGFRIAVDKLFLDWTDQADSAGVLDFYGLQSLATRGMVEGGETFTRMRTRRMNDGLIVPLQLQIMEGDQCNHLYNDPENNIRQGIQYNAIGARTAFYMYKNHPGEMQIMPTDAGLLPVVAADICHLFRPARPGSDRGEPWLAAALRTLHDLDQYLDAELVRQKMAAMFLGFITNNQDGFPMGSDEPTDDGTAGVALDPGTLQVLQDGEDIKFATPPAAGSTFEAFIRENKRLVASGTGTVYEELSGDYSQLNDRTMRAAFNAFRRSVDMWQHHLVVFQWARPIWHRFIDLALLSGALTLPPTMTMLDAYRCKWIPQGWPYIHPVQDVEGKALEIQTGLSSRSQKVSETGYNSADIDAENAADNKRADSLKLIYTSDGRQKATPSPTPVQGAKQDA